MSLKSRVGEQYQDNDRGLTSTELLFHQEGVQSIEAVCLGQEGKREGTLERKDCGQLKVEESDQEMKKGMDGDLDGDGVGSDDSGER